MTPQELKYSILQLAIQGKLVEQRPEEGTAKELYQRIQEEKKKLIKEGKIKKEKPLPEITEDEIPFGIPENWKWYRLGELFNIVNGFTPLKSNPEFWEDGDIPWFTIEDVHRQGRFISSTEKFITRKALSKNTERIVPADTVLLCCTASVGEYAYTKIPLTTNQQFNAFVLKEHYKKAVYPLYVFEYAKTLKGSLIDRAGKTTFNFVSVGKLSNMLIPLPPHAEQKRIVAKIEELLPYIDRYEKAWNRLEDLNKRFPADMQKSILQMAIQGKLVEQHPEEGTAEELYKQIQEEKKGLIKAGKIKKGKPLPEITEDEIPFDIPESWKWVRITEIIDVRDGTHDTPKYVTIGVPLVTSKNLIDGNINFETAKLISAEDAQTINMRSAVDDGDILFAMIGTIGNPVLVKKDREFCIKNMALFKAIGQNLLHMEYFLLYLQNEQYVMKKKASGGVQSFVSLRFLRNYLLPLPPLAEQKRIVAKLKEILPLCERLK